MSQQELLTHVVCTLRQLGIEHMLTGSHASSLQGEARATHDIDLVVSLSTSDIPKIVASFQTERFYLSEVAIVEAIRLQRMFNLLEVATGEKVDFWLLTNSAFDRSRFARRRPISIGDLRVDISTPEDTILMKLDWCRQSGGSTKQLNDVIRIFEFQAAVLDDKYLQHWIEVLGAQTLWQQVLAEAVPFSLPDDTDT